VENNTIKTKDNRFGVSEKKSSFGISHWYLYETLWNKMNLKKTTNSY